MNLTIQTFLQHALAGRDVFNDALEPLLALQDEVREAFGYALQNAHMYLAVTADAKELHVLSSSPPCQVHNLCAVKNPAWARISVCSKTPPGPHE